MAEKDVKVEEKKEVKPTSTSKPKKSAGISVPLGKAGGTGK